MKSRYSNLFTLLVAASLQASVVWQDPSVPLLSKLVCTGLACLGLALTREKALEVEQIIVTSCLVAGTVLTVVLGHLSAHSAFASATSTALAVATQVRHLLASQVARGAVPAAELGDVAGPRQDDDFAPPPGGRR